MSNEIKLGYEFAEYDEQGKLKNGLLRMILRHKDREIELLQILDHFHRVIERDELLNKAKELIRNVP